MTQRHLIVVLGMHRGGTSVVARALKALGISLGSHLSGSGYDNPKGFWEDSDIMKLNEAILGSLGLEWNTTIVVPDDLNLSWENEFAKQAINILASRLSENAKWAFKDPRTSRLLFFWNKVFNELHLKLSFVIAVRHPKSVIQSLHKRNRIDPSTGYRLWLDHMIPTITRTHDAHRVFIDYDLLVDNPRPQLKRLAERLEQPLIDSRDIEDFTKTWLDRTLRHSIETRLNQTPDKSYEGLSNVLYTRLREIARDNVSSEDDRLISFVHNIKTKLISNQELL